MSSLTLWCFHAGCSHAGAQDERRLEGPISLAGRSGSAWEPGMPVVASILAPVEPVDGVIAVLLVPGGAASAVNEVVVSAGMHLLRHGDRVDEGGFCGWLAFGAAPREERYDAALHGADLFCFRTKTRFVEGAALVVCPGTAERSCGMMYSKSAWDTGLCCHACGWDPQQPAWRPPVPAARPELPSLLALAHEEAAS